MGLLARINGANDEREIAAGKQTDQIAEHEAKPDAGQQAAQGRQDYSNTVAAGEDRELQDEAATPEEQEQFTQMERALAEMVYGEKASHTIIKSVAGAGDPVDGVSMMAHDLVKALSQKFPNAEGDVLMAIGESAVEQVVDLVESAKPDIDLSDDQMAEALSIATTRWMESNPGSVDGDMMQYMTQEAPEQLPQGMGQQQPQQAQSRLPMEAAAAQGV